jgi:hypothetical protein
MLLPSLVWPRPIDPNGMSISSRIVSSMLTECNSLLLIVRLILSIMTQKATIINQLGKNREITNRKIDLATAGLHHYIYEHLTQDISPQNALTVSEYVLTMKNEINMSDSYRETTIKILYYLCKFVRYKDFLNITRGDVLRYLDNLRQSETLDPIHKWVGTYNVYT